MVEIQQHSRLQSSGRQTEDSENPSQGQELEVQKKLIIMYAWTSSKNH